MPTIHEARTVLKQSGDDAALDLLALKDERIGKEVARWWRGEVRRPGPVLDALLTFPQASVRIATFSQKEIIRRRGQDNQPTRLVKYYVYPFPAHMIGMPYPKFWVEDVLTILLLDSAISVRQAALHALGACHPSSLVRLLDDSDVVDSFIIPAGKGEWVDTMNVVIRCARVLTVVQIQTILEQLESRPISERRLLFFSLSKRKDLRPDLLPQIAA